MAYASRRLSTIEVNGTFYALQKPDIYRRWAAETPDDFVFTFKANRYVTHIKRLKDAAEPVATFMASGLAELGPKLGAVLWQLPPHLRFDGDRMTAFLATLPPMLGNHPVRHCVEVRHESFATPAYVDLLRQYNVASVVADTKAWPVIEDVTADFVYARLQGGEEGGHYEAADVERWRDRLRAWAAGGEPDDARKVTSAQPVSIPRPVFAFFDKHVKLDAPLLAESMLGLLDPSRMAAAT